MKAFSVSIVSMDMGATARNRANTQKRPRRVVRFAQSKRSVTSPVSLDFPVSTNQPTVLPLVMNLDSAEWLSLSATVDEVGKYHLKKGRTITPDVLEKPEKKGERKPHGFWNDLDNVQRELEAVNAALGRRGRRQMPRLAEMKALGRGDLIAALAKYGGSKKVAAMLRWGPIRKSTKHLPSSLRTQSKLPYTGVRRKVPRRISNFWSDLNMLQTEVTSFAKKHRVETGIMPTQALFKQHKRADLLSAITRHGGLRAVAASMNLRCARYRATLRFDFKTFSEQVCKFSDKHCPGKMPTAAELIKNGASSIANAVAVHGGYPTVANRLKLQLRNTESQGARTLWSRQRLGAELRAFTREYYPELALGNHMPTERQLRKEGRNDLSYAISKFGLKKDVMRLLGFTPKASRGRKQ